MVDVNKPVTNSDLVAAIQEMKENSSIESQDKVINEVMRAHFLAPVTISPSPQPTGDKEEVVLKQDTLISINMIENEANQSFFLAFTDWEELGKWHKSENQQTLIITFDDLASMVLREDGNSEGFVINPYGQNIIFNKKMIHELKVEKERRSNRGVVEHTVEKDTVVQLGQPRVYPQKMVDAIKT